MRTELCRTQCFQKRLEVSEGKKSWWGDAERCACLTEFKPQESTCCMHLFHFFLYKLKIEKSLVLRCACCKAQQEKAAFLCHNR